MNVGLLNAITLVGVIHRECLHTRMLILGSTLLIVIAF